MRRFILRYQDRLLYGTDIEFGDRGDAAWDASKALEGMAATYRRDAAWLATDQQVEVPRARAGYTSQGLALPASVVRKIYSDNARKWYPGL